MKRRILVPLGVAAVIFITAVTAVASNQVKLLIDGAEIDTGPVQVQDGKVTAPVKDIAEALGAEVGWNPQSESVVITPQGIRQTGPRYGDIFQISGKRTIGKTASPDEVLLAYYEALYSACNLPEDNKGIHKRHYWKSQGSLSGCLCLLEQGMAGKDQLRGIP